MSDPVVSDPVVAIKNLRIALPNGAERTHAVDGVSFDLTAGKIVCVVGESGSGKSMCAHALLGLLPDTVKVDSGEIRFDGRDLLTVDEDGWRDLRGRRIAMVFQEPMTALNPLMRIGDQLMEVFEAHDLLTPRERRAKALALVREVGLPDPERIIRAYPHQLSGGQRQRAMIAMALALEPAVLVADEPTTALDVTIQAQVLELLDRLRRELSLALLLITHDLGVVGQWADRVVVMYAGRKVEEAPPEPLFNDPLHPYTQGLLAASPRLHDDLHYRDSRLSEIPGSISSAVKEKGCPFVPRCPQRRDVCRTVFPDTTMAGLGRSVACHAVPPPIATGPSLHDAAVRL